MSETKTHYRKAFDSPYLSSADIVAPQYAATLRSKQPTALLDRCLREALILRTGGLNARLHHFRQRCRRFWEFFSPLFRGHCVTIIF